MKKLENSFYKYKIKKASTKNIKTPANAPTTIIPNSPKS